jgi:transposase-like protein
MPTASKVCENAGVRRSSRSKTLRDELLDELLREYGGSAGVTGPDGLLEELTRAVVDRAMGAELSPDLISRVTDAVNDEMTAWQADHSSVSTSWPTSTPW